MKLRINWKKLNLRRAICLIWYEIDIARSLFVLIFIHRWIAKVACVSCGASRVLYEYPTLYLKLLSTAALLMIEL